MSTKYPGGIISKTAPTPSGPYADSTAPGIWTLEQQAYWQKLGQWPTQGNVNPSAFIENLFSTWLYTGTGAAQTITNGIDLSTYGGLVWIKNRNTAIYDHNLFDTARGTNKILRSDTTGGQLTTTDTLTAFGSTGFTLGSDSSGYGVNDGTSNTYASWTFRKQAKFFDVVTYTGTGSVQNIAHNLGSVPGCIIVKRTDTTSNWVVYHRSLNTTSGGLIALNLTSGELTDVNAFNSTVPTSTVFTVGSASSTNGSGGTFVAYVFAHDAGGFGLSGSENVISCGSFSCPGGANATINLGYEPQWVLYKESSGGGGGWYIADTMRGFYAYSKFGSALFPNATYADSANSVYVNLTSTGFESVQSQLNGNFIYVAIRRGPMAVPTLGTSVFSPNTANASAGTPVVTNFPVDLSISVATAGDTRYFSDRLRGVNSTGQTANQPWIASNSTGAELTNASIPRGWDNTQILVPPYYAGGPVVWWNMRRAPGFFDEVCYTGTGSATTFTHNLGAIPEMMIVKTRSDNANWAIYTATTGATKSLFFTTAAAGTYSVVWNDTAPTSSVFTVGTAGTTNTLSSTYVAYLFATCAGVSKVGSYTGTGTTLQVNCGFTSGARFVLIKRTDDVGDWYVWDSARGIVAGNDPYLLLNSAAAEVTGTDYVDTYSAGFEISSTAPSAINASGGTFIFLAIA